MKFNTETPVWQALTKYANLIWVSLLWVVCCIPVVTIGPSTAAMMTLMLRFVRKEEGELVTGAFFKTFRTEFKRSFAAGLIVLAAFGIVGLDVYACARMDHFQMGNPAFWAITVVLGVVLLAITLYVFPILARYEVTGKQLLQNAVFCAGKHPVKTFLLILLLALIIFAVAAVQLFAVFLVGPLLFLMAKVIQTVFMKAFKEERAEAKKRNTQGLPHQSYF